MRTPTEERSILKYDLSTSMSLDIEVFYIYICRRCKLTNLQGGAPFVAKVELKQPVVQAIAEDVKDATSVVLVDYRGLTVAEDTEMRKQLREAGVVYKVCKNTMMKRAFEGTDFAALDEHLEGQVLSLFLKMMQQLRQESFANLQRMQKPLN